MDHNMGMGMGQNKSRMHMHMHMTFFWGKNADILFSGWPGTSGGMYALALIVIFLLAVLVEFFNRCRILGSMSSEKNRVVVGLCRTAMHAVRVGLAYLVMLAIMSFNGGVLLAAVAGHAVGFLLFCSAAFGVVKTAADVDAAKSDLPPMAC